MVGGVPLTVELWVVIDMALEVDLPKSKFSANAGMYIQTGGGFGLDTRKPGNVYADVFKGKEGAFKPASMPDMSVSSLLGCQANTAGSAKVSLQARVSVGFGSKGAKAVEKVTDFISKYVKPGKGLWKWVPQDALDQVGVRLQLPYVWLCSHPH